MAQLTVLGPDRLDFDEAFRRQMRLWRACHESGGERSFLLLTEHPPVITIGRSGDRSDILAGPERLERLGVTVAEANRGGEVTFHGPGQIVAYPIIDLRPRGRDLHRYLRNLEGWLVRLCRSFGVPAHGDSPHTGVWVSGSEAADRKVASIGIAARRWVAYHGVALNVDVDLSWFDLIVPCGMRQVTMTSLERELGGAPPAAEVAGRAADYFAEDFQLEPTAPEAEPA
ncbi:MAG: lipoyl(octanoyl) transferase LipB [Planctomycetota bacterium]